MDPFGYQLEAVRMINHHRGRALVAADPGLGKTLMSLLWVREHPEAWPVLVVCPASVKPNWKRHAREVLGTKATVLEGERPEELERRRKRLVVINYDILGPWLPILLAYRFRTVVLDEIHYCSARTSQRTKSCRKLARRGRYLLGLSGTPIINRPVELFPMLNMLCPGEFKFFLDFARAYCDPQLSFRGRMGYRGATNLPDLRARLLKHCLIRIRSQEVENQLPPRSRRVVLLPIERPEEYSRAEVDFIGWLSEKSPRAAQRAQRSEQFLKLGYLKRLAAELKHRAVVEWIQNFLRDGREKLVVFGWHTKLIQQLREDVGARSVVVTGSTSAKDREARLLRFQQDRRTRVFYGNLQAAGVGLDGLQHAACTTVTCELEWRSMMHLQAERRVDRLGQQRPCCHYYLVAEGTIETRLCRLIQRKQEIISEVLDGGSVEGDLDVFDQLLAEYQKRT